MNNLEIYLKIIFFRFDQKIKIMQIKSEQLDEARICDRMHRVRRSWIIEQNFDIHKNELLARNEIIMRQAPFDIIYNAYKSEQLPRSCRDISREQIKGRISSLKFDFNLKYFHFLSIVPFLFSTFLNSRFRT